MKVGGLIKINVCPSASYSIISSIVHLSEGFTKTQSHHRDAIEFISIFFYENVKLIYILHFQIL